MRAGQVGSVLLTLGVVVGVAAGVGLLVGFEPARLPAALLNIAAYKLTFLAAAGLLGAGAILLRHVRREEREETRDAAARMTESGARQLGEGHAPDAQFTEVRRREHARPPQPQERAR